MGIAEGRNRYPAEIEIDEAVAKLSPDGSPDANHQPNRSNMRGFVPCPYGTGLTMFNTNTVVHLIGDTLPEAVPAREKLLVFCVR